MTKSFTATGPEGTFTGEVVATFNANKNINVDTNAITHDDFNYDVFTHKVEAFIDDRFWKNITNLKTDQAVLNASIDLMADLEVEPQKKTTTKPLKTVADQLKQLFE